MTRLEQVIVGLVALAVAVAFFGVVVLLGIAQIHPYRPRTGTAGFFSSQRRC
jgi:hypothetical protein